MNESQFGPGTDDADDRTRVTQPGQPPSQGQPAQPPGYQAPPAPQQPAQQAFPQQAPRQPVQQPFPQQAPEPFAPAGYGGGFGHGGQPGYPSAAPQRKAGYFGSLFDLSYANLGAPKFARVFQLLFMIVSGIAVVVALFVSSQVGSLLPLLLGIIFLPLAWLLLNTFVRLVLEAVVGIVQTAENSETMLEMMRDREGS